ncbi:Uncharacterized protein BM_BM11192 [Brugia malayi]|uniref:Uncharacterized protein n=1 Tax=Brugia malayi TaxID=6279 RepID=A0A4E9FGP0_BRUMA|nr:Uncharacterized protein BM_BM11192 [Brugia malayi]VIO95662.1 Uncharacterized protein BM_BM11192 [Brugia malayi]
MGELLIMVRLEERVGHFEVNLKCIQEISLEFLAQINFCNIIWLWPRMNECNVHLSVRLSVLYVAYIDGIIGLDERQTDR